MPFLYSLAIFFLVRFLVLALAGIFTATASLKGFAGLECRNFGGRNLDFFPGAGLITFRSLRSRTSKLPKPIICTLSQLEPFEWLQP